MAQINHLHHLSPSEKWSEPTRISRYQLVPTVRTRPYRTDPNHSRWKRMMRIIRYKSHFVNCLLYTVRDVSAASNQLPVWPIMNLFPRGTVPTVRDGQDPEPISPTVGPEQQRHPRLCTENTLATISGSHYSKMLNSSPFIWELVHNLWPIVYVL